jgi:glycosidase
VFIENHDQARSISRWGNDSEEWRAVSAKLLAMLEVTLGGTQYVFQGEELGLKNFPRAWGIEEYKDVASQNWYHEYVVSLSLTNSKAITPAEYWRSASASQARTRLI